MVELNKKEMLRIEGGGLSSSVLNALTKGIGLLFEIGQSVGSAIRRLQSGQSCSL